MHTHELLTPQWTDYELIDCGNREKLERFGKYILRRPEPQAVWPRSLDEKQWQQMADALFVGRSNADDGKWVPAHDMPSRWFVGYAYKKMRFRMRLALTGFKHVGLFPEQAANWNFIYDNITRLIASGRNDVEVLNLFAYTGGATLAAASAGARVTHLDSVHNMVSWANDNLQENGLQSVRWVVDDALKYVRREVRRGRKYSGIILDPPAYGRGTNGEKWILEQNIAEMLDLCSQLLEEHDAFLVLNLYSMGLSSTVARSAIYHSFGIYDSEQFGELCFTDRGGTTLPLGVYYRFTR